MKKIAIAIFALVALLIGSAHTEENPTALKSVYKINIHVLSHRIGVIQEEGGPEKIFPAGTAKPKYVKKDFPFGVEFRVKKIGFNRPWWPSDNIRKEYAKRKIILPKFVPPGSKNPLGIGKMYIGRDDYYSDLGIHHTNEEHRIGKNGARLSHGCTRLKLSEFKEITQPIFEQNDLDADILFEIGESESFEVEIDNGPIVVHLKD
jgi:lipoprotein-anchoring transpeptidase ErfK/SrfK